MDNKDLEKAMQDLVEVINEMAKIIHKIKTEQLATVNIICDREYKYR